MAERFKGRVVHFYTNGSECPSKEKLLSHLLEKVEGVTAHHYDPQSKVLTAYIQEETADESAIVRALMTAGMYPVGAFDVGAEKKDNAHGC